MSNKCGKCGVEFVANEVVVKCVVCKVSYHHACTRLGSAQNFTKAKNKSWKCDSCKDESASSKSNVSNEDPNEDKKSILEALNLMKNDINANIDSKIGSVRSSIDSLTGEFKELNTKLGDLEKRQDELKTRCEELEEERDQLRGEMREMQIRLRDAEQYARVCNLEIQGLPLTEREDIYLLLSNVARAVSVNFRREDISVAHRLRLFSKKHAHPPIIVQFVSRSVREAWLSAARTKKKLDAREVSASLPSSQVFVNEHLTGDNKTLLGRARRLAREKKIHFAGYFNGKVLVKVRDGDTAERVCTLDDLDRFDR